VILWVGLVMVWQCDFDWIGGVVVLGEYVGVGWYDVVDCYGVDVVCECLYV